MNINQEKFETDADRIKGFDLKIDASVQRLCEIYNTTSGSTRSVIYVLLVINILSLMAVINTHLWNWTDQRISNAQNTVQNDVKAQVVLTGFDKHQLDSIKKILFKEDDLLKSVYKDKLLLMPFKQRNKHIKGGLINDYKKDFLYTYYTFKYKRDSAAMESKYLITKMTDSDKTDEDIYTKNSLARNQIENSQHVSIPFMSNSFDVNDLALVSGFSFVILLIVLRFTLAREKDNLQIAFNSISERYDDEITEADLMEELNENLPADVCNAPGFESLVNFKRRRYHYNSLSMNEIFNLPKLDISPDTLQKTWTGKIVKKYMFSFPYIIYLLVLGNDILTGYKGLLVSPLHTAISYCLTIICLTIIARLCNSCNNQKNIINKLFDNFYDDNYTCKRYEYLQAVDSEEKINKNTQVFYAYFFITKMMNELRKSDQIDSNYNP